MAATYTIETATKSLLQYTTHKLTLELQTNFSFINKLQMGVYPTSFLLANYSESSNVTFEYLISLRFLKLNRK